MITLSELTGRHAWSGKLVWIGTRPGRRTPMVSHTSILVDDKGLAGDHTTRPSDRSITLIQKEHLLVIASLCRRGVVLPQEVRRNLVVTGINLLALKDRQFWIGNVLLEGTGICAPCSRMEAALGEGGYNAMRGHGGITARIMKTGTIAIGDQVVPFSDSK